MKLQRLAAVLIAALTAAGVSQAAVFGLPGDTSANAQQRAFHNRMIPFCRNSLDDWEKGDMDAFWKRFRVRLSGLEGSPADEALTGGAYQDNPAWFDERLRACAVRLRPDGEGGYYFEPDYAAFRREQSVTDPAWKDFFALRDSVRVESMDGYLSPVGEKARRGLEAVHGFLQKHPGFSAAGELQDLYALLLMQTVTLGDNNTSEAERGLVRDGKRNFLEKNRGYPCHGLVARGQKTFGGLYEACRREFAAGADKVASQKSQFGTVTRRIAESRSAAGKIWPAQHEVVRVNPKSLAAQSGLRAGDRIVSINGAPLRTVDDIRAVIWPLEPGTVVNVLVVRGGEDFWVPVKTSAP